MLPVPQCSLLCGVSSSRLVARKFARVTSPRNYSTAFRSGCNPALAKSTKSRILRHTYAPPFCQVMSFSSPAMDPTEVVVSRTFVEKMSDIKDSIQGEVKAACGTLPNDDEEEEMEMEDMFVQTAMGSEWGGPMRGGRLSEPTRYGDWERKGRCSDF